MASRPEVSQALLAKSRCEFGIRIQFLTGFLRRHEWVVDSNCGKLPSNVDFAAKVMKDQITYGVAKGSMKTSDG